MLPRGCRWSIVFSFGLLLVLMAIYGPVNGCNNFLWFWYWIQGKDTSPAYKHRRSDSVVQQWPVAEPMKRAEKGTDQDVPPTTAVCAL
eukprot:m.520993 g.520993  ORF g.520993 m.520993 type:complete len:88 (+) comp21957_c0_seq6:3377-3640(+)